MPDVLPDELAIAFISNCFVQAGNKHSQQQQGSSVKSYRGHQMPDVLPDESALAFKSIIPHQQQKTFVFCLLSFIGVSLTRHLSTWASSSHSQSYTLLIRSHHH
jgi:hypothetical protein